MLVCKTSIIMVLKQTERKRSLTFNRQIRLLEFEIGIGTDTMVSVSVRPGICTTWYLYRYDLVAVRPGIGTIWYRYDLVGIGTTWYRYDLVSVRPGIGTT